MEDKKQAKEKNTNKPLPSFRTFTVDDKTYMMTFNRKTAKELEDSGVLGRDIGGSSITVITTMFFYSLRAKHPRIKPEESDALLKNIAKKDELYKELFRMYGDVADATIGEPEEDDPNAINWE